MQDSFILIFGMVYDGGNSKYIGVSKKYLRHQNEATNG